VSGFQWYTYFNFFRPRPIGRVCSWACGSSDAKYTIIIIITASFFLACQ